VLPADSFYPRISPHHPCKPGPPPWALSKPHFTQFSPSHVLSLTMSQDLIIYQVCFFP
jgi:hypothetical protein